MITAFLWVCAILSTGAALGSLGLLIHYLWTESRPGTIRYYMKMQERARNGKL